MNEQSGGDVKMMFDKLRDNLADKISEAIDNEISGEWSRDRRVDSKKVLQILEKSITVNKKGKFESPKWIVVVRNPHLYKILLDQAYSDSMWWHDLEPNFDLEKEKISHVAEELLHGVPALGEQSVTDRVYGVAFLFDKVSDMPILQPFFAFADSAKNHVLTVEVMENPSRILGGGVGVMDTVARDKT